MYSDERFTGTKSKSASTVNWLKQQPSEQKTEQFSSCFSLCISSQAEACASALQSHVKRGPVKNSRISSNLIKRIIKYNKPASADQSMLSVSDNLALPSEKVTTHPGFRPDANNS